MDDSTIRRMLFKNINKRNTTNLSTRLTLSIYRIQINTFLGFRRPPYITNNLTVITYITISILKVKLYYTNTYVCPFKLIGCKLPSGVAFVDVSDGAELIDDNDVKTSETGVTPKDVNI